MSALHCTALHCIDVKQENDSKLPEIAGEDKNSSKCIGIGCKNQGASCD